MKNLFTTEEQQERNERMAAAVTSYGVGTKSFNASAENRESKRQQAEATARYRALPKTEFTVPWPCTCRSFNLPHDPKRHSELRADYDWRLESERHVSYRQEPIS